jgi:hypothetical protein
MLVRATRVWVFMNIMDKKKLAAKVTKKCCHVGILEGVAFQALAWNEKVEWTNFCSPTITLLESFVRLTVVYSVKRPLEWINKSLASIMSLLIVKFIYFYFYLFFIAKFSGLKICQNWVD